MQMDPLTIETRDVNNAIPLIMAAATAAGKSNIDGFPLDQPILDMLIAAGANKDAVGAKGLTAYGTFQKYDKHYCQMLSAMMGTPVRDKSKVLPGLSELKAVLFPSGGPTAADLNGGKSAELGFVEYSNEDSDYEYDSEYEEDFRDY